MNKKAEVNDVDKLLIILLIIFVFSIAGAIYFCFNPVFSLSKSECVNYVGQTLAEEKLSGFKDIKCIDGYVSCVCSFTFKNGTTFYREYQKNITKLPLSPFDSSY